MTRLDPLQKILPEGADGPERLGMIKHEQILGTLARGGKIDLAQARLYPGQIRRMKSWGRQHPAQRIDIAAHGQPAQKRRFPLMSTYELALKCSNLFNLLDARGAISVTERVGMIARIRNLSVGVAKVYAGQQTVELQTE